MCSRRVTLRHVHDACLKTDKDTKAAAFNPCSAKTAGAAILIANLSGDAAAMAKSKDFFDEYLELRMTHTDAGAAYPYHW